MVKVVDPLDVIMVLLGVIVALSIWATINAGVTEGVLDGIV
jgi:hypothetical protein